MLVETPFAADHQNQLPIVNCTSIGAVSMQLTGAAFGGIRVNRGSEEFVFQTDCPHIKVQVESVSNLSFQSRPPAFDSGAVWRLFRGTSGLVFDFTRDPFGAPPYKRMFVDHDFHHALVKLNAESFPNQWPVSPMQYPADELLITNYLAFYGLGAEVHGCGIIDSDSGGHLFLGHSGAGKSTTTRLWETFANPEILSDDRIILRLHDRELWMYGTPWHGEAEFASPGKAKLNRIYILQHGKKNAMKRLSPTQSVGEVFARCFPPFHSATGLERTLEFLSRALDVVPCYDFEFVPDRSAIETVRKFYD